MQVFHGQSSQTSGPVGFVELIVILAESQGEPFQRTRQKEKIHEEKGKDLLHGFFAGAKIWRTLHF